MVGLKVTGTAELAAALRGLDAGLRRDVLIDALTYGAEPMRSQMASNMARSADAPHAADHVGISVASKIGGMSGGRWLGATTDNEATVAVGPGKNFFYWQFQEWGTVNHRAQPAMRPAFDSTADTAISRILERLWQAVAKGAKA